MRAARRALMLLGMGTVLLCLCGCEDLAARNARMEDLALLRVLAVDTGERGISAAATTGAVRQQTALTIRGEGATVDAACLAASQTAAEYPVYSHVERLLVGEDLAKEGLTELLGYLERDSQLRLSTRLWLVRGEACDTLAEDGAEETARRLEAMEELEGLGDSGVGRTAGELLAALDRGGCGFLPALSMTEEGLSFSGYGVLREGRLVCYLEGDCATGANLLLGAVDGLSVTLADGAAVRITGASSCCAVRWQGQELAVLEICCAIKGTMTQLPGGAAWTGESRAALEESLSAWAEDCVRQCAAYLQCFAVDPLELGRRAGAQTFWRWDAIAAQWMGAFPGLEICTRMEAEITP